VESFNPELATSSIPDSVTRGESLSVSADVDNVGAESGDAIVDLVVDGQQQATKTTEIADGESASFTLDSDSISPTGDSVTVEIRLENGENGQVITTTSKTVTVEADSGNDDSSEDDSSDSSSGSGGGDGTAEDTKEETQIKQVTLTADDTTGDTTDTDEDPTDGSDSTDTSPTLQADSLTVDVETSTQPTVSVSTYEADLTPSDQLRVTGSDSASGEGSARGTSSADIETAAASFEQSPKTVAAGYAVIETSLNETEIRGATCKFKGQAGDLDERGADPTAVTLYRQQAGEWSGQETAYLGKSGGFHEYESTMSGFSVFALGTGADVMRIDGNLSLTGAGAADNTVTVGEAVTVSAIVENRGQTRANETFELTANDEVVANEEVSIAGGNTTTVELTFRPDTTGEYRLGVGAQEVPLTVEGDSGFPWWIVVIIGLVIVVLLVIWRRRKDKEEEQSTR